MSSNVAIIYQPLTQWPAARPRTPALERAEARFNKPSRSEPDGTGGSRYVPRRSVPLSQTLDDLDGELGQVDARDVVIQIDVTNKQDMRDDVRRDGRIRDDARVHSPAVVLTFKSAGTKPLVFACDYFKRWQDNLRALALGLEALRKLERYHIAQTGDQYRGWMALPAAGATVPTLSTNQAAHLVARLAGDPESTAVLAAADRAKDAIRRARAKTHPDAGGRNEDWTMLQEAERILRVHFGGNL